MQTLSDLLLTQQILVQQLPGAIERLIRTIGLLPKQSLKRFGNGFKKYGRAFGRCASGSS